MRAREKRIYPDYTVDQLPFIPKDQVNTDEWAARAESLKRLIDYIGSRALPNIILEVGCGNGWFSKNLATSFSTASVIAIDINENELLQGSQVFKSVQNLKFIYGDIFTCAFEKKIETIVLAGTIPYFQNLPSLINRLLGLLSPGGEIHILDSPMYNESQVEEAQKRSSGYFDKQGCPGMKSFFHHHTWESLSSFRYQILYNPVSFGKRLIRFINKDSPFPWIKIVNLSSHLNI